MQIKLELAMWQALILFGQFFYRIVVNVSYQTQAIERDILIGLMSKRLVAYVTRPERAATL